MRHIQHISPPAIACAVALALVLGLCSAPSPALAATPHRAIDRAVAKDETAALLAKLRLSLPDLRLTQLRPSGLPGLYEGVTQEGSWLYVNRDGTRVLVGDLFGIDNGRVVDLTALHRQRFVREALQGVPEDEYISYRPANLKHSVSVFTDIDCGYCRLLHKEMKQLHALGIAVHYLAFPRSGVGSASYVKAVSAWCASDPQAALTQLKSGQGTAASVPQRKDCDAGMVARQYQLGQRLGVTGTPALVLESGRVVPGYVPAAEMAEMLAQHQAEAARP